MHLQTAIDSSSEGRLAILEAFEAAWRSGHAPVLDHYLPRKPTTSLLAELVQTDLEYRLRHHQPCSVDHYLHRYPQLLEAEYAVDLIVLEQRLLGQHYGIAPESYLRRYPDLRESLLVRFTSTILREEPSEAGAIIAGRYEVRGEIGRGSFARVHRAWDRVLLREVAVKFTGVRSPNHEAQTLARLNHPHILNIIDAGRGWLVTELADSDLASRIAVQSFTAEQIACIGAQLASGLAHAHAQGVLHRDIKPANILFHDDRPTLADFCLSDAENHSAGTPAFRAPELQHQPPDVRSDIYSLGKTLAAMAGTQPLTGTIGQAIARATHPYPDQRYASAAEFARALHQPQPRKAIWTMRLVSISMIAVMIIFIATFPRTFIQRDHESLPIQLATTWEAWREIGVELGAKRVRIREDRQIGQITLADVNYQRIAERYRNVPETPFGDPAFENELANVLCTLGNIHADAGDETAAVAAYERAVRGLSLPRPPEATTVMTRLMLAEYAYYAGNMRKRLGHDEQAKLHYEHAVAELTQIPEDHSEAKRLLVKVLASRDRLTVRGDHP